MIEFGKPKKLLCEMGKIARNKFLAKNKRPKIKPKAKKGRSRLMLTYNGETRSVIDWAKMHNILPTTLKKRIHYGWTSDKLFSPVRTISSPEEMYKKRLERQAIKISKEKARGYKFQVRRAIVKVLQMRKRRSEKIDTYVDYQESIHYAIARVLDMRKSRAKRLRYSWDMAA